MSKNLTRMRWTKEEYQGEEVKPSMKRAPKMKRKPREELVPLEKHELYSGDDLKYDKRFLK